MANKVEKIGSVKTKRALTFWQGVNARALQRMSVDLSSRQTAVLLHVYLQAGPHSIKSLAEQLGISKPAVCRAVDALEKEKLAKRTPDRNDRRNVFIMTTAKGSAYLSKFADIIMAASKGAA